MLVKQFDASKHTDVIERRKTEKEVFREFVAGWEKKNEDSVSLDEFYEYYTDVGAVVDKEPHFEYLVKNSWRL